MSNPKISIITIAFNNAGDIKDTLESVISQDYANKEYIVIDGASTDGTVEIIEQYRDHIAYYVSEPDRGISDAFNKGIQAATGDYIVMINAGDMLTSHALELFAKNYQPGYDVIKGDLIRWNSNTGSKTIEDAVIRYPAIPFNFLIGHPSTYIARQAYLLYGGYREDYLIVMDLELMLRLTKKGCKFRRIPETLSQFRMGGLSQSNDSLRLQEMKRALRENGRNKVQVGIFGTYIRLRTFVRNLLDMINPDIKSKIITKL